MSISFPMYLLLDVSASMAGAPLRALNGATAEVAELIQSDARLSEEVMLCIISFSNDARIELPLDHPTEIQMPKLNARGGTNYAPPLRLLRETVARDVPALKAQGFQVYRPVAFFLTDGNPTDSSSAWDAELEHLQRTSTRPTMIAVGIGGIDPAVLHKLAGEKGVAFISSPTLTPIQAVSGFKDLVLGAVNSLTSSRASGRPSWRIPKIEAFDTLPDDFLY